METLTPYVQELQQWASQVSPPSGSVGAFITALLIVLGGLGMSVFGAKLARPVLTLGFIVLGAALGNAYAEAFALPAAPCILGGLVLVGIAGFLLFRVWVGALTGLVLSMVALGAFGYARLWPQVDQFHAQVVSAAAEQPAEAVSVVTAPDATAASLPPDQWVSEFSSYVAANDPNAERFAGAIATAVLLIGLLIGVAAVRTSLVLTTSVIGTLLVATGMAALCYQWMPQVYRAAAGNPVLTGGLVGVFLLSSLALQAILTRPEKPEPEPAPVPRKSR